MPESGDLVSIERIGQIILEIRGRRVVLDSDLAQLYGVETKALNRSVKRNISRFPEDFIFRLTQEEFLNLKCQFGTSSWGGARKLPFAFTEHGAIMAAMVLNSPRAIQASVFVVRAFAKFREMLVSHGALQRKLTELERKLETHDVAIREIIDAIKRLAVLPPLLDPAAPKIGFRVKERTARYRRKR